MSSAQATANIRGSRYRAWETRRAKYGPSGHSGGAYSRTLAFRRLAHMALDELGQAHRQLQIVLYANQFRSKAAHKAIDRIENAEAILKRI
jgi:hypothetical protein